MKRYILSSEAIFLAIITFFLGMVITMGIYDIYVMPNYEFKSEAVYNYGHAPEEARSSDFEKAIRIKFDLLNDDYEFIDWEMFVNDFDFIYELIAVWEWGVPLERQNMMVHELFNYRTLPEV